MGADSLTVLISSVLQSAVDTTTGLCDAQVDNGWRTRVFDAAIIARAGTEVVEQSLTATQQNGHDHELQFVDQRSPKVLPDGGRTASDEHIAISRRLQGCAESRLNPTVHERNVVPPFMVIGGREW